MKTKYKQMTNVNHKGFTLVEVMISLVIMAVGMLGLASIQAVGMQNNKAAYSRTLAMQAAYNMADIIRSYKDKNGNIIATFNAVDSTVPNSTPSCIIDALTSCSPANMASADIYQWKTRLQELLPSGRGTVDIDGAFYRIRVMWDEDRTGVTGEDCDPADADDLKCHEINVQI